jgi:hypothetical protein
MTSAKVSQAARALARKIKPSEADRIQLQRRQVAMRRAKVTATSSPTVSVAFGEDLTTSISGIARLASYTPAVNDWVWCLCWDGDMIVLGKEA